MKNREQKLEKSQATEKLLPDLKPEFAWMDVETSWDQ